MSVADELFEYLLHVNVEFQLTGNRLNYRDVDKALNAELKAMIKTHKPRIIELLKEIEQQEEAEYDERFEQNEYIPSRWFEYDVLQTRSQHQSPIDERPTRGIWVLGPNMPVTFVNANAIPSTASHYSIVFRYPMANVNSWCIIPAQWKPAVLGGMTTNVAAQHVVILPNNAA